MLFHKLINIIIYVTQIKILLHVFYYMIPIKCVEFNKYMERCRKKTHLSYYDYHTVMLLASMQISSYDAWQQSHDVTNNIMSDPEPEPEFTDDIVISDPINSVADLISVADRVKMLKIIKPELESLNSMIGMHNVKTNIVNQILYYVQNMHVGGNDYKHIVISGPPGTGKTEIAKIMGSIFSKLATVAGDHKLATNKEPIFIKATRSDLIAGYVGQTAIKTRALIEKCIGGTLFIDEAYSFGDDTFSKECVDTLCESLSAHKDNLTVIIAGYEDKLQTQFFALNPGLESRFSWHYTISAYTPLELHDIFMLKVKQQGWTTSEEPLVQWFEKHSKQFTGYGRDIETLLFKVKVAHSRRVFAESTTKKCITMADMNAGYKIFMEHKTNSNNNDIHKSLSLMYC